MNDFEKLGAHCIRRLIAALWLALTVAGCAGDPEPPLGAYRAVLSVEGGDLPFGLELVREDGKLVAYLVNGPERARAPDVQLDGDELRIAMPGYPHRLQARFVDARFEGTVNLVRPRGVIKSVRLIAVPGQQWRFFPKPAMDAKDFSGRWALSFRDEGGVESRAIAELHQEGHEVWGTVMRASGDDRFIAGEARGDTLFLSRFDGGTAYLYLARLGSDGVLAGDMHSGGGSHDTFWGRRDAKAALPDPTTLSALKPGVERLEFSFPDLDGSPVSYPSDRFAGKVVLVTIGGSWCPNCHDEAVVLRDLLKSRRAQGLEVIQLMFEHTPDFGSSAAAARDFVEKFSIDYPVLIAGTTASGDVLAKLPQLAAFKGYPSMLVIDRKGKVREVHTGFNGPATGAHYEEQNREIAAFVDELLAEPR